MIIADGLWLRLQPTCAQLPGRGDQAGSRGSRPCNHPLPLCFWSTQAGRPRPQLSQKTLGGHCRLYSRIAHQAHWRDRKCHRAPKAGGTCQVTPHPAAFGPRVSYRLRQPLKHKRQKGKGIWRCPWLLPTTQAKTCLLWLHLSLCMIGVGLPSRASNRASSYPRAPSRWLGELLEPCPHTPELLFLLFPPGILALLPSEGFSAQPPEQPFLSGHTW